MLSISGAARQRSEDATPLFSAAPNDRRKAEALLNERISKGRKSLMVEAIAITPALAEIMLERNIDNNRPMTRAHINRLARAMNDGEFMITGQAIQFDARGVLIDGQHRLTAVVQCGRTVRSLVAFGVATEAFATIDIGRKREGGDVLHIAGKTYPKILAAASHLMAGIESGSPRAGIAINRVENHSLIEFVESRPEMAMAATDAWAAMAKIGGQSSAYCVAFALMISKDRDAQRRFVDRLKTGVGATTASDPINKIRDRVLRGDYVRLGAIQLAGDLILAWNLWRRKETKRTFGWKVGDSFPVAE